MAWGGRAFRALALAAPGPTVPCGACRQALAEFCDGGLPIALGSLDPAAPVGRTTLGALFPAPFALGAVRDGGRG